MCGTRPRAPSVNIGRLFAGNPDTKLREGYPHHCVVILRGRAAYMTTEEIWLSLAVLSYPLWRTVVK